MKGNRWHTERTWPGGAWGEALAQVRKAQHLTQRDIADFIGVPLSAVRSWEDGMSLPDRSLWPKLEEAMGLPVPDPRVPDRTPAERELIDTMLLMVDELRLVRQELATRSTTASAAPSPDEPSVLGVDEAASYLGVSPRTIRGFAYERRLVHFKVGRRVKFRKADLDQFVEDGKCDPYEHTPWQIQSRKSESPRKRT